jgi:hypothetical protein
MAEKKARGKYSKEVEEIRRLQDLNKILKAGDLANAVLSDSAKESETMSGSVLDSLLEQADTEEHSSGRGLEIIERLTTTTPDSTITRTKKTKVSRSGKGKVKVQRALHFIKRQKKERKR